MLRIFLICLLPFALVACSDKPAPEPQDPIAAPPIAENGDFEIPTVTPLQNGNIVVRFKKTGCSVLFDRNGNLLEGGRMCDDVDLHRARKAAKSYIAERDADFLDV